MPPILDPTDRFLRLFFQRAVQGVLAAAAAGCPQSSQLDTSGGGGDGAPPPPTATDAGLDAATFPDASPVDAGPADAMTTRVTEDGRLLPTCSGYDWRPLQNVNPSQAYDYISWRDGWDGAGDPPSWHLIDETGTPCGTAPDRATCLTRLDTLSRSVPEGRYLLTTRGESVETWVTPSEQLALLGTIDTADEAVLAASTSEVSDGTGAPCPDGVDGVRVVPTTEGYELEATSSTATCPDMVAVQRVFRVGTDGSVELVSEQDVPSDTCWFVGRRPPGLRARRKPVCASGLGRHFAREAHFEAASVHSFRLLARELRALGAPHALVARARRAARDEVRHARAMRGLAERFGGRYEAPVIERRALRSLRELALDNAVEGCVNETFAALVATYQAQAAGDVAIADVMARVAVDETEHAAISWDLAHWCDAQLLPEQQDEIRRAQHAALDRLETSLRDSTSPIAARAGLPDPQTAGRLLHQMRDTLFGNASA